MHGDLKPSNVLLGPSSRVAIADLGLSRLFDTSGRIGDHPMAGTPAYLAPEFSRTDLPAHLLHRSDIYALGVIAVRDADRQSAVRHRDDTGHAGRARVAAAAAEQRCGPSSRPRSTRRCCRRWRADPVRRTASADELRGQLLRARESIHARQRSLRVLVADDDDGLPGARARDAGVRPARRGDRDRHRRQGGARGDRSRTGRRWR